MAGWNVVHANAARETGEAMARRYADWELAGGADLPAEAARLLARAAPVEEDDPLVRSCREIARVVGAWGGHPYHSATHHAEVATNAMTLAGIGNAVPAARHRMLLLCAALGHDLLFDPRAPHRVFLREAAAAGAVDSVMEACGAGHDDRRAVSVLILATELAARPAVRAAAAGDPRGLPRCLGQLADPVMAELAAILSDADLLGSAGLTVEWTRVMSERLEAETGKGFGTSTVLRFLEGAVGDEFASAPGRWFGPNLERIREGLRTALPSPA